MIILSKRFLEKRLTSFYVTLLRSFGFAQNYGKNHIQFVLHRTDKRKNIAGSIGFRIATLMRTNFNLVNQFVVLMPGVQTL